MPEATKVFVLMGPADVGKTQYLASLVFALPKSRFALMPADSEALSAVIDALQAAQKTRHPTRLSFDVLDLKARQRSVKAALIDIPGETYEEIEANVDAAETIENLADAQGIMLMFTPNGRGEPSEFLDALTLVLRRMNNVMKARRDAGRLDVPLDRHGKFTIPLAIVLSQSDRWINGAGILPNEHETLEKVLGAYGKNSIYGWFREIGIYWVSAWGSPQRQNGESYDPNNVQRPIRHLIKNPPLYPWRYRLRRRINAMRAKFSADGRLAE